ncbi:MAG: amino acid permease [Candidatus Omnitrophica bacterium]|nr:amino acid permease [Candidatus Omnitrophota bacterium]
MVNFSQKLFKIKDLSRILADSAPSEKRLKKVLGAGDLVLMGIGVIVGAGIFATVGTAAAGDALRPGAGPALILSFAITAVACAFAALCYAEMASLVPISGSAYTYSYATFGELVAWIIGWDLILEYGVGSVAVSLSWSGYFQSFLRSLGIDFPAWATIDFRSAIQGFEKAATLLSSGTPYDKLTPALQHAWNAVHGAPHILGFPVVCNLPASLVVLILTAILVRGIRESSTFNIVIVIIKLLVLAFFIGVGAFHVKPQNWTPFAPNGFAGIKAGAAIAFFAYIGFDVVSTAAEETRNPKRDVPIGILGSLAACALIYMSVAAVFTGLVPFAALKSAVLNEKAGSLAFAMNYVNLGWAAGIIAMGSIAAQLAVLLILQMGQSRILFSMARDGLLPPALARVHPRYKTPHVTTILVGLIVAFFAAFTNIEEMVDLTNVGTLFAFTLVCLGVIILRVKEPNRHRSFSVPFSPVTPLLGVAGCVFLMTALPGVTWLRFVLWLVTGLVIYFLYSIHNSLLHKK